MKSFPVVSVFREAWRLTIRHRFLWFLGILAGAGQGFGLNLELGRQLDRRLSYEYWQGKLVTVGPEIMGWLWIILVAILALWLFSLAAEAGMMKSVMAMTANREARFFLGMREGRVYVWPFVKLTVLLAFLTISVGLLIGIPAAFLVSSASVLQIFTGSVGLLVVFLFGLLVGFLFPWITRYLVLRNHSVGASVESAFRLLRRNLWTLVSIGAFGVLWQMVVGLAIIFILLPFTIAAVAAAKLGSLPIFLLTLVILLVVGLPLFGLFTALKNAYYTLAFEKIVHES